MGGKSSKSTQTVSIPPEVLARYNSVNQRAEQAASTPFQRYSTDPSAFVAPLTATQQAGIANTNASAGTAQPYYGAATGYALAGGQAVNPGQLDVQQYMNPYLGTVVGNTANLLNQENQQAMSGQTGNAIQQGAFGGDRAGIAAANLSRQQNLAFGNTIGGLLQQGYGQALGTAQQQQGVYLGADQANRQALQQTAASLAGLGAGAQTAGLQGAQAQLAAGQVEQGTEQAGKTALYNQFLQEMSYPYQQAQFLANIAMGTGALSGSTTTGTSSISDRRAKHDVHEIGRTFDGQPIYNFKYNGDDRTQIGLMAQDVERRHPEAVGLAGGMKTVDYGKATHEAAHRGHFASGGLAGSSEGGMVHMGHMGEGYAGGGMIDSMGYGSSPFIGYDPTTAFQSLYGGLLGMGKAGEGGVGGIGIPTGGTSHGELAVAKMDQPQMPDMAERADQFARAATGLGKFGDEAGIWSYGHKRNKPTYGSSPYDPVIDGAARGGVIGGIWSRFGKPQGQGDTFGDPVDVGRREEDSWHYDENGNHKPHFGGGMNPDGTMSLSGGLTGGLGYALGGGADSGDNDTDEQKKLEAAGTPPPETHSDTPITVTAPAPPKVTPGIPTEAPKVESLKPADLNMAKPRTFLDGVEQATKIGANIASMFAGAKNGGAIGYADGGDVEENGPMDFQKDALLRTILAKLMRDNADKFSKDRPEGEDIYASPDKAMPDNSPEEAAHYTGITAPVPFGASSTMRRAPEVSGLMGGLREKIMHGEGTDKFSNPYDVVYGANPRTGLSPYANPEGKLSSMPIGAVQDFQRKLIAATRGKIRGVSPEMGTGAVGAYQFTRDTLADLARRIYGPDWKSVPFSPEVQDKLAAELARERHGHLGGTWAFAAGDESEGSPVERAALLAQRSYASGGLVGRKGYADGYVVDDGSNDLDADSSFAAQPDMGQFEAGKRSPSEFLATQVNAAQDAAQPSTGAAPDAVRPSAQSLGTASTLSNVIAPYLSTNKEQPAQHHNFFKGLGRGEARSWLPLLAGIGASMSGPYRGIVGIGRGLAAGVDTAQKLNEYELQQQQLGLAGELGRGNLGVARAGVALKPTQLETQKLQAIAPALGAFINRFEQIPDPSNPAQYLYRDKLGQIQKPLTGAEFAAFRDMEVNNLARQYNIPPESLRALIGPEGAPPSAGGLGTPITQNATGTAGASGAGGGGAGLTGTSGDAIGSTLAHPIGQKARRNAGAQQSPAGVGVGAPVQQAALPKWKNVSNYLGEAATLPMPEFLPRGSYTLDTDPALLNERFLYQGDQGAKAKLDSYRSGDDAPVLATGPHRNQKDPRLTQWAQQQKQQGAQVGFDAERAVNFYSGSGGAKTDLGNVMRNSELALKMAKNQDPTQYGQGLVYDISRRLAPYGFVGGETAKSVGASEAAQRAVKASADRIRSSTGIDLAVPPPPSDQSPSSSLLYSLILNRALAKYAYDYTKDFRDLYEGAHSAGKTFGQVSKFTGDWSNDHNVDDYIRTEVHKNGFLKGMTDQQKGYWLKYIPEYKGKTSLKDEGIYKNADGSLSIVKKGKRYNWGPDSEYNP